MKCSSTKTIRFVGGIKERKCMIVGENATQLATTFKMAIDFPYLLRRYRDMKPGDARVIALAHQQNDIAVSTEQAGSIDSPEIPVIRKGWGIHHAVFTQVPPTKGWIAP